MSNIIRPDQYDQIKKSGQILKEAMDRVCAAVKPGISTAQLDQIAEKYILSQDAEPSFKGYEVGTLGFYPASLCVSLNNAVVHGLPSKKQFISEGDLVSLDLGVRYQGLCTDMARTVIVGEVNEKVRKLVQVTEKSLYLGIAEAKAGHHIGAIGHAVQKHVEQAGFSVVRDLVGHGLGELPHDEPQIPNYGSETDGPQITEGMALAIEPMVNLGKHKIKYASDGWTILTKDDSLSAHFEHTILIINGEPIILTE